MKRQTSKQPRTAACALFFTFHVSLFVLTACRTPAPLITLPPVRYADTAQAAALLNARRDAVRTVQAQATLKLTPTKGKPQTLDAQLVHAAPGHARLRAGKLNHNVFDLTVTPDGLWAAVSHRVLDEAPDAEAGLIRLAKALPFLLRGPDYGDAHRAARQRKHQLNLAWGDHLTADLDAGTLTPLRFAMIDPGQAPVVVRPVYTRYRGVPWLRSAVATGAFGRIELIFHSVDLNQDLNPRAFKPPRRATRHPR